MRKVEADLRSCGEGRGGGGRRQGEGAGGWREGGGRMNIAV